MSRKFLFLVFFLFVVATFAYSQERITDAEQARAIFEEVEERQNSINTETAKMEMVITDHRGRTRNRTMQMWSSTEGETIKSLLVFESPGNVRGTSFLTINENGSRSQRLYLPSLGRIQTIGSSDRSDRFMGSDFTYEDLGDQSADDYEFEWLEKDNESYRVRASKPDSDQYRYVEFYIDREKYSLLEIHYFDENDNKIKRLEAENFEQLTDRLWSPGKMTMYDLREDRKTEITWSGREINTSVEEWRFTERGLRRGI